jgi:hypothetical protein
MHVCSDVFRRCFAGELNHDDGMPDILRCATRRGNGRKGRRGGFVGREGIEQLGLRGRSALFNLAQMKVFDMFARYARFASLSAGMCSALADEQIQDEFLQFGM